MIADRIIAFLDGLNSEELDRMPPARLRQFSELCRHWHQLAELRLEKQSQSGVLGQLRREPRDT